MARILIIYSTVDGHTHDICERLQQVAATEGHQISLQELTADSEIDLEPFDRIVIGASVRYGKHRDEVTQFIEENVDKLRAIPSAFFSVNSVARNPEKRDAQSNSYVRKFLEQISWKPPVVAVFGGKIDYPIYRFWDKSMVRFIMWMTNGPTDTEGTFDFTDWDEVEAFGLLISAVE